MQNIDTNTEIKIMNEDKDFDDLENWELVAWMDCLNELSSK